MLPATVTDQLVTQKNPIRASLVVFALAILACGIFVALQGILAAVGTAPISKASTGFLGLGVLGAIFANSTGAGGGVVFIPAFAGLGFSEAQAVATSFGIQCFGMTAGALTWTYYYHTEHRSCQQWQPFLPAIMLSAALSAAGLWAVYAMDLAAPAAVTPMFATFSLLLGGLILATLGLRQCNKTRSKLEPVDVVALALIALAGGAVTAWLSVGVGEFIAFYLILRRYDATLSVATAVVVSALTVWSAAPEQLINGQQAVWEVILWAGPGALIGALLARHLVLRMGAQRLKLFFGSWLLVIGVVEFVPLG
jgi:uncharacterized membrane protein YfcA